MTLAGPHRDDLVFELNNLPAKGYASHGESWSFALALKLASAELLRRDSTSGDPVLILDDVFAELDQSRRRRLAEAVTGYEQVIITAAVFEDVPAVLAAHAIHIHAGAVVDGPPTARATRSRSWLNTVRPPRSTCGSRTSSATRMPHANAPGARPVPQIGSSVPFGAGRDPRGLGETISSLTAQLGWNSPLAQSDLLALLDRTGRGGDREALHPRRHRRGHADRALRVDRLGDTAADDAGRDHDAHRCKSSPTPASPRSVFRGPTPPPGKRVPDQFQGGVHAIPTGRETNQVNPRE